MAFEAPIARYQTEILPEWTDYNRHLNVAYFVLIFDQATDVFYPLIGLGEPYRNATGKSTFAVESHITYAKSADEGDIVAVTTQLLGFDDKRIHYFHTMVHPEEGYQIATLEQLALHVDLTARKVEPMPEESRNLLAEMTEAHVGLTMPPEVGSVMGVKRKG